MRSSPGFVSILAVVVFVGVTVVIGYNRLISITRRSIIRQQVAPIQIVQWNIDSLKLIDSQRIVLHETVNPDLNIRQSCAIESVAKHHPDRPIQLIMRKTDDQLNNLKPWINVLNHYSKNVELILIEETEYFNDTALFDWLNRRDWRETRHQMAHLSDYTMAVSVFRGGGLFLDINNVLVVKSLTGPKWNNFFVKLDRKDVAKSDDKTLITTEMFHLVHGHHLIDILIANLAETAYDRRAPEHEILSTVLDSTLSQVCGDVNQCLDVHLYEIEDIFLPDFNSLMKRIPVSELEKFVAKHAAVLLEWNAMASLQSSVDYEDYNQLCNTLLTKHCPYTVASQHLFIDSSLC